MSDLAKAESLFSSAPKQLRDAFDSVRSKMQRHERALTIAREKAEAGARISSGMLTGAATGAGVALLEAVVGKEIAGKVPTAGAAAAVCAGAALYVEDPQAHQMFRDAAICATAIGTHQAAAPKLADIGRSIAQKLGVKVAGAPRPSQDLPRVES